MLAANPWRQALLSPRRPPSQTTTLRLCLAQLQIYRLASSLSAIHNGIRRSGGARRDASRDARGRGSTVRDARGAPAYLTRGRKPASADLRIRKGKKDITEKSGGKPLSRKARFYDPNDDFGKKSQAYKFKSGEMAAELRDTLRETRRLEKRTSDPASGSDRDDFAAKFSTPGRDETWPLDRKGRRSLRRQPATGWQSRGSGIVGEESSERDRFNAARGERRSPVFRGEEEPRREQRTFRLRNHEDEPEAEENADDYSTGSRPSGGRVPRQRLTWRDSPPVSELSRLPNSSFAPLSIPYTTAASQFVYGRSAVRAALHTARRKAYKLYIAAAERDDGFESRQIASLAENRGIPIQEMDSEGVRLMDKMSASRPHNGYVLEASPVPQLPVIGLGEVTSTNDEDRGFALELGQQSPEDAEINGLSDVISVDHRRYPLVVMLDSVLDPGNLGGVLRTASFFGADAVAISSRNSAQLTSVAIKASSGASEQLNLLSVASTADFLRASRKNGWRVYAAVPSHKSTKPQPKQPSKRKALEDRNELDVFGVQADRPLGRQPCILLLGSEGAGLSRVLRGLADYQVVIPNQSGSQLVDSLNVSVAAGVLCSAFLMDPPKTASEKMPKGEKLF
jgi:21S rRNA (GM2251-2'-O)-methyltransferase